MNILNISGPTFLLIYTVFAAVIWAVTREKIISHESRPNVRTLRLRDPYEIAYLRGGAHDLIQVAVLSLIRRGLLEPQAETLRATENPARDSVSVPIEAAILNACRSTTPAAELKRNPAVERSAGAYRGVLTDGLLMPTAQMQSARKSAAGAASVVLIIVALAKMGYASAHGHQNIQLLAIAAVISLFALYKIASAPRTRAGDEALRHLGTLFARVRRGPPPSRPDQLHEALLLAAVFGEYELAAPGQISWRRLFPKPSAKGGDGGSSCGSTGCGGGGCGGGCGGCGS